MRLPPELRFVVLRNVMEDWAGSFTPTTDILYAHPMIRAVVRYPVLRSEAIKFFFSNATLVLDSTSFAPLTTNAIVLSNLNLVKSLTINLL